jgi:hypothetical protein
MQQEQESDPTSEAKTGLVPIGGQLNPRSVAVSTPSTAQAGTGENTRLHIVLDQTCLSKLKKACDDNERTTSAQIRYLIRNHL